MSETPTLPVTFRPGHTRVILLTAGVAIFLVISGVAMLLDLGPGERVSFFVTGALIFWALAQLARVKVVADESGVTVVNGAWPGRKSFR